MVMRILRWVKVHIDACMGPVMRALFALGVRPIHFTFLSLPSGLFGVWSLFNGPLWGTAALVAYLCFDIMDGTMARTCDCVTERGARLDFAFDMTVAAAFLGGLYFSGLEPYFAVFALILIAAVSMEEIGLLRR